MEVIGTPDFNYLVYVHMAYLEARISELDPLCVLDLSWCDLLMRLIGSFNTKVYKSLGGLWYPPHGEKWHR